MASDIVTRTRTETKRGVDTSDRFALGCDIREDDPRLTLDCWDGEYAIAVYRFTIPRDAWAFDWTLRGRRQCCDQGRFIRTGTRSNRSYRVRVMVTGWRAHTIRDVAVTFEHKQRR